MLTINNLVEVKLQKWSRNGKLNNKTVAVAVYIKLFAGDISWAITTSIPYISWAITTSSP